MAVHVPRFHLPIAPVRAALAAGGIVAPALPRALDTYLEDASLSGLPTARIVHGKGTGAIRQAVLERLRSSPHVERFAAETDANGGEKEPRGPGAYPPRREIYETESRGETPGRRRVAAALLGLSGEACRS